MMTPVVISCNLAWLDTVHRFSVITQKDLHPEVADAEAAVLGFLSLETAVLMQYKPFVLQLAVGQIRLWDSLLADPEKHHQLPHDGRNPWYQMFPINPEDAIVLLCCNHASISQHDIIYS